MIGQEDDGQRAQHPAGDLRALLPVEFHRSAPEPPDVDDAQRDHDSHQHADHQQHGDHRGGADLRAFVEQQHQVGEQRVLVAADRRHGGEIGHDIEEDQHLADHHARQGEREGDPAEHRERRRLERHRRLAQLRRDRVQHVHHRASRHHGVERDLRHGDAGDRIEERLDRRAGRADRHQRLVDDAVDAEERHPGDGADQGRGPERDDEGEEQRQPPARAPDLHRQKVGDAVAKHAGDDHQDRGVQDRAAGELEIGLVGEELRIVVEGERACGRERAAAP